MVALFKVLGIESTVKALAGIVTGSAGTIFGHLVGAKLTIDKTVAEATTPATVPTEITDVIAQLSSTMTLVLGAVAVLALIVILRR